MRVDCFLPRLAALCAMLVAASAHAQLLPVGSHIDDRPARVLSTANGKIFVDHGDPLGHATIIPSPTATRADALVLTGFLTTNLLDQGP